MEARTINENGAEQRCSAPLYFWKDVLSDEFRKQVGIDIAAGENDYDVLAPGIDAAGEQRSKADGAAGFDHELELAIGKGHGCSDFLVGGDDAAGEQLAVDGESQLSRYRRHQRVADGARGRRVRLAVTGLERERVVVIALGLGDDDLRIRE